MRLKILFLFLCVLFAASCVQESQPQQAGNTPQNNKQAAPGGKIKIGFSMATLKEERWQRDREAFEAHCKQLNVECVITVADNKAEKQVNDVDNLLTQGINALVIAPQ